MKHILVFVAGAAFGAGLLFLLIKTQVPVTAQAPESVRAGTPASKSEVDRSAPAAAAPIASEKPFTPPASDATTTPADPAGLQPGSLLIPVTGIGARQLLDTFGDRRGAERAHEAIDIAAPKGTPVIAVDAGRIAKLFSSKPGGLTVYQFDPTERYAYYYAHLDSYAPGLAEGRVLKRGELVGYVGSSGNADPAAPHLHFAIFELGPEKRWWQGTAINPYPLLTGR